ncbi:MAG: leucine-rich repeat domain-containing protein [Legionellales bacterium]
MFPQAIDEFLCRTSEMSAAPVAGQPRNANDSYYFPTCWSRVVRPRLGNFFIGTVIEALAVIETAALTLPIHFLQAGYKYCIVRPAAACIKSEWTERHYASIPGIEAFAATATRAVMLSLGTALTPTLGACEPSWNFWLQNQMGNTRTRAERKQGMWEDFAVGLRQWVAQATAGEHRDLAEQQIRDCILNRSHTLDLSHLGLKSLPESFDCLHVDKLLLNNNQLTTLPDWVFDLGLTSLSAQFNQITELPKAIAKLSILEELNLQNNRLVNLPKAIAELSILEELNLQNNLLVNLPKEIAHTDRLQQLDVTNNLLTDLSEEVSQAIDELSQPTKEWRQFYFALRRWAQEPEELEARQRIITCIKNSTDILDLSHLGLNNLPSGLYRLKLTTLLIHDNQLKNLHRIYRMNTLRVLEAQNNRIKTVNVADCNFDNLEELHLENNLLDSLSITVNQVPRLKLLKINHNLLDSQLQQQLNAVFPDSYDVREIDEEKGEAGPKFFKSLVKIDEEKGGAGLKFFKPVTKIDVIVIPSDLPVVNQLVAYPSNHG